MTQSEILQIVAQKVRQLSSSDTDAAHDWWHVFRVNELAKQICARENGDEFRVSMIALLHDVYDWKLNPVEDEERALAKLLKELGIAKEISAKDLKIITHDAAHLSFRGGANLNAKLSAEGKIAQDADRLDGIGAMGIARTFAYSGAKNREIHNPDKKIREISAEEYQNPDRQDSSIQHFYEKLLKMKSLMNTETARRMAAHRHEFMEQFLGEFYAEWEGKK